MWRGHARDSNGARSVPRLHELEGALTEREATVPEQTLPQLCQWAECG